MRREWITIINAAVREHGIPYSRFTQALNVKSNIELDRKILADLALNEPYSFKAVFDEVKMQAGMADLVKRRPIINEIQSITFPEALQKGYLKHEKRRVDEVAAVVESPKADFYGLRFPERDAKTDADYLRLSFKEEDEEFKYE